MANLLTKLANPDVFLRRTKPLIMPFGAVAAVCLVLGTALGLLLSPPDVKQGESVRIMYVHVPAAWMALQTYAIIAISSFVSFVWRHRLADIAAKEAAPFGLLFTVLAIVTGALWGKVTWGVFWDWDMRMTSMLVLAFIYMGYIAIWQVIENDWTAARAAGILAMLGAVNLPIIKFSVDWWDSLHQKASIRLSDKEQCLVDGMAEAGADPAVVQAACDAMGPVESTLPASMLIPLLVMALGYTALFSFLLLLRMHTVLAEKRKAPAQRAASSARLEEASASS